MIIAISGKIGSGKDTVGSIIQYLVSKCDEVGDFESYTNHINNNFKKHSLPWSYSGNWEIKKYANKLKEIVCLLTGCTLEQLEDQSFKLSKLGPEWDGSNTVNTYRDLLQILGTECGREIIHPNIWVNALFADYQKESIKWDENGNSTLEDYPKWIITDMRFPNELEAVKKRNGITIRINRENPLIKIAANGDSEAENYVRNKFLKIESQNSHPSETALDNATFDYVIENSGTIEELIEKVREILIKEKLL